MIKKILFDLEAAQPKMDGSPHGGGEYAQAVFTHLAKTYTQDTRAKITTIYNPAKWLDPAVRALAEEVQIPLVKVHNIGEFQDLIDQKGFHKFYSSAPRKFYECKFENMQVMFTIHGLRRIAKEEGWVPSQSSTIRQIIRGSLRQVLNPGGGYTRQEKDRKLVNIKATKLDIVVPSLHTKYNLISTFPELSGKNIRVLYSPMPISSNANEKLGDHEKILNELGLDRRHFFLLVNARRAEKNAQFGMQALDSIFSEFPSLKRQVLVIGADDKYPSKEGLQNKDCFKLINYTERNKLECLYREAFALLYPSLDEGFGYPPLECMRHGTPVLCSINTSMAEIYSGAALFFNPMVLKELEIRILTLLLEKSVWDEYSAKGLQRYREVRSRQEEDLEQLVNLILSMS